MPYSDFNGNPIFSNDECVWFYSDTGEQVNFQHPRRCPYCKLNVTAEGHDGCLGTLPNVKFACCGHHSSKGHPYVVFENELIVDFESTESLYKYFGINQD